MKKNYSRQFAVSAALIICMLVCNPIRNACAQEGKSAKPTIEIIQVPISDTRTIPTSTRFASFMLGKNLALTGKLMMHGKTKDELAVNIRNYEQLAKGLGAELPPFPEINGFEDSGALNKYLFRENDSAQSALVSAQSEECGELFKLASIGVLARMMYHEGTDGSPMSEKQEAMNKYVIEGIASSSFRAKFESQKKILEAASPFVKWMSQKKPSGNAMNEVYLGYFEKIESLLLSEINSESSSSPTESAEQRGNPKIVMVDVELADGKMTPLSRRAACYLLGRKLAMALNLKLRGVDRSKFEGTLRSMNKLAEALDLEFKEPPKIEGIGDIWAVKDYLINDKDSVKNRILEKTNEGCAGLFQLSSTAMLSPLLYMEKSKDGSLSDTDKEINQILLNGLKTAAVESNFRSNELMVNVMTPLVKWIEDGKPQGPEMGEAVDAVFANVKKALLDEIREANSSGKVIKLDQNKTTPPVNR